jgi:hypothetical protein
MCRLRHFLSAPVAHRRDMLCRERHRLLDQLGSTAVFEAVYSRVPSLCLAPEVPGMGLPDLFHDLVHNGTPGRHLQLVRGGVLAAARRGLRRPQTLAAGRFPADGRGAADYIEHFLGPADGRSSERLLDLAAVGVRR